MLFFKGIVYRPFMTILCILLIVMAMLLSFLGIELVAKTSALTVEEADYTEIAVITPQPELNGVNSTDLKKMYESVIEKSLFAESTHQIDIRTFAGAYSPQIAPVSLNREPADQYTSWHLHQDICVLMATVVSVEADEATRLKSYTYTLNVDQMIYSSEKFSFGTQENVLLTGDMTWNSTGAIAEVGKTYLVWGQYLPTNGEMQLHFLANRTGQGIVKTVEQNGSHFLLETGKGTGHYIPLISELNGSLEEFWQTEIGQLWQKTVMQRIEIDEHSLNVIGTDCLESIYTFNTNNAIITSGKKFSIEQYESGERVCIISDELAEQNALQVGDFLPLQVYQSTYVYDEPGNIPSALQIYDPYKAFGDEGEWRIVGIYDHEYNVGGEYQLHPNTVFVTNKSLTGDYTEENYSSYPDLFLSFVLPRDGMTKFLIEAEIAGYAGWFVFSDGGRSINEVKTIEMQATIDELQRKTAEVSKFVELFSTGMMVSMILLFILSKKKEIGHFYAIETPKSRLFVHLFVQSLIIGAVAFGLSWLGSILIVPPLVPVVFPKMSNSVLADELMARFSTENISMLSVLGRKMLIFLIASTVCAELGAMKKYQFEYHERA